MHCKSLWIKASAKYINVKYILCSIVYPIYSTQCSVVIANAIAKPSYAYRKCALNPHITTDNDRLFIQEKANALFEVYFSIHFMEILYLIY